MPWSIQKRSCKTAEGKEGGFTVVKETTGEEVGCHMTEEAAQAQLRALYAAEALGRPARYLLSRSDAIALGGRLFLKELARVGRWTHPETGQKVEFTLQDLREIAASTSAWIGSQGGRIPLPENHTFDPSHNLGFCRAVFVEGEKLYGVIEAGDDEVAKNLGGRMRDVSIFLEGEAVDSQGKKYKNVLTHVAVVSYPVLTEQENFVPLSSRSAPSEAVRVPVLRLASGVEERKKMSAFKGIAADLGLTVEALDDTALEAEIRKKLAAMREEKETATAASSQATQALSAKTGEVVALAGRMAELEKDIAEREQVECDREVSEVKALAAKHGKPDALEATRERFIRDRWVKDREAAKQMLALAREIASSGPGTQIEGAVPVKTPEKESLALAKADAIETAKREARAMGWQTREEAGKLLAFRPGEKREIVLVG